MTQIVELSSDQILDAIQMYLETKHLVEDGVYNLHRTWHWDNDAVSLTLRFEAR